MYLKQQLTFELCMGATPKVALPQDSVSLFTDLTYLLIIKELTLQQVHSAQPAKSLLKSLHPKIYSNLQAFQNECPMSSGAAQQ